MGVCIMLTRNYGASAPSAFRRLHKPQRLFVLFSGLFQRAHAAYVAQVLLPGSREVLPRIAFTHELGSDIFEHRTKTGIRWAWSSIHKGMWHSIFEMRKKHVPKKYKGSI